MSETRDERRTENGHELRLIPLSKKGSDGFFGRGDYSGFWIPWQVNDEIEEDVCE